MDMRSGSLPFALCREVQRLYLRSCVRFLVVVKSSAEMVVIHCGIKQGCLSSGSCQNCYIYNPPSLVGSVVASSLDGFADHVIAAAARVVVEALLALMGS